MKTRPENSKKPENPACIDRLRREITRLEGTGQWKWPGTISSGCRPLDRLLPGRGFRRGTLIEWLGDAAGCGVETLALAAARQACLDGGALVVVDRRGEFYPPAAVRLGIETNNLIVVRAAGKADSAWALDQAIRSPGVAAVMAWPEAGRDRLGGRAFRRLQLAAEQSGCLGLLIRPAAVRHEPSWADVRLLVEPRPGSRRRVRLHLLRCRGAAGGRSVEVEIDDETRTVHLVPRLGPTEIGRRA